MIETSALAAGLGTVVFALGGVSVSSPGGYTVLPAQPDVAHMEVVWPTSQMALNTSVLMADGTRWQVPRVPRRLTDGSVSLTLRSPSRLVTSTFVVAKDDLDTPIWWVGELPPTNEDVVETNPGTPGERPDLPNPDGVMPTSHPAPTPSEPTEG